MITNNNPLYFIKYLTNYYSPLFIFLFNILFCQTSQDSVLYPINNYNDDNDDDDDDDGGGGDDDDGDGDGDGVMMMVVVVMMMMMVMVMVMVMMIMMMMMRMRMIMIIMIIMIIIMMLLCVKCYDHYGPIQMSRDMLPLKPNVCNTMTWKADSLNNTILVMVSNSIHTYTRKSKVQCMPGSGYCVW